jgi:hypothetical protein
MTLDNLFDAAVAEVDSGIKSPCRTSPQCVIGCPRCIGAVMQGSDIGVASITVYRKTGIVRLRIDPGCSKTQPCEVAFSGVPINIR